MGKLLVSAMNHAPELTGCGKYTGELVALMVRRGHEVEVVTAPPHYPGWTVKAPYRNRYSTEVLDGARLYRCPVLVRAAMGGVWRLIAPMSFALTSAPVTLWRALSLRPDTVLSIEPTLFAAPFVLLSAWLAGARTVLHVQDLEVDAAFAVGHLGGAGGLKRLAAAFELFCLSRFDTIVTISQRMAEKIAEKGIPEERIALVRNWVDLGHIRPSPTDFAYREELGLPRDAFVALYSGNVGPKQGLDVVVEAARLLADRNDIVFAIAGEGPSLEGLRRQAADLPNVRFLPFQPYARLSQFLSVCDLHLLPQQASAADLVLPSKLGGMLASGRTILVTAEPGTELADFLAGAATLVSPGDAGAMADAVRRHQSGSLPDTSVRCGQLAATLSEQSAMDKLEDLLMPAGTGDRQRDARSERDKPQRSSPHGA
ncbi:WcaI family glycosyltransferase [Xanthobacter aminoxidans]|uniref:WcaI family glycosyltransferase n=1 Tax=Xanthobacter aminoxidans TaxID=186280 RepID=UPI002022BF7E|nr:WcaI family glycosyltransferase [Xanthobacter aminoxidans]MCL8381827.1 WcaI family glycosyltransferase [Xanthobacter aminoxidans]